MSDKTNRTIARRHVLAGMGASGIGLALGAYGVTAGEQHDNHDEYDIPVAVDWQESFGKKGEWWELEAFPDEGDDRMQDSEIDYCGDLASIDDPLSSDLRTDDDYTDPGDPLINFHGIEPGYHGEVTLSYHLCDQPGKVKLKASDVEVNKKLKHLARARVWYDEYGNNGTNSAEPNNNTDGGYPGDNEYQEYEPVIVQGSLDRVLRKLKQGVRISGDPYVASPSDMESYHYYAYPRVNTGDSEYDPVWITDDNIKEYVKKPKVHDIENLSEDTKLDIDGVGNGPDGPLPELCVTIKKVIKNKKGNPVGFKWTSNLPLCRIEVAGGERTKLNVYDRAREGVALAPRDDDNDDHGHDRCPMTGFMFGACGPHDADDWCIKNSNTGYIGFEWWVPKHVKLKDNGKFEANFDFKAKPCVPDPDDCPSTFTANDIEVELLECDEVDGQIRGTFRATVLEDLDTGTQVRVFGPGGNPNQPDVTFSGSADEGDTETFTETSTDGTFTVGIGTGVGNSEYGPVCCPDDNGTPPVDCPSTFTANDVEVELLECDEVDGQIQGSFRATALEDLDTGTQVRVFGPGGNPNQPDATFSGNTEEGETETFTEISIDGTFTVGIGTGVGNSEYGPVCCPELE